MPETIQRFEFLYTRFLQDQATPEEVAELMELSSRMESNEAAREIIFEAYEAEVPAYIEEKDWSRAEDMLPGRKAVRTGKPLAHVWTVAASAVVLLAIAMWFFRVVGPAAPADVPVAVKPSAVSDVKAPALSYATLTLGDGQVIALDSVNNGVVALQNDIELTKTEAGHFAYTSDKQVAHQQIVYNTLANPRGSRVITMTFHDGSRVWLNAASSVTFPVFFEGDRREVSITGEAFFDVAHDPQKKFVVHSRGIATEVLGTQFNVHSFGPDGEVQITLVDGKVHVVSSPSSSRYISPGQQAVAVQGQAPVLVSTVNVGNVVAWKEERFAFEDTNIKQIMDEISRWYDVDVVYDGNMKDLNFGGSMSRHKNVSEFLRRMEATQAVKFAIDGKKVTVIKTP